MRPPPLWRPWAPELDGPIPPTLLARANDLAVLPAGTTESFPLPGVTALIRAEPSVWGRDEKGDLVPGCFQVGAVYLPTAHETIVAPTKGGLTKLEIAVGALTIVSLTVGTIATIAAWKKKRR